MKIETMDKEQVTFDGIPIPLTLETILNAFDLVSYWLEHNPGDRYEIYQRQRNAFRARILRMDAEKDELEELRNEHWKEIMRQAKRIAEYRKEIIEQDEEIRVLEKYIKDHDYKTILDYMEKYLEGDIE